MQPALVPFPRRAVLGALPLLALTACAAAPAPPPAAPRGEAEADRLARLVAAYPDHLRAIDGGDLVWADGTRMPTGAGLPARPFETMLRDATIADQMRQTYTSGPLAMPPPRDHSPGRLRNAAFFRRMYGDCRDPRAAPRITRVTWMPRTRPQPVSVTSINDVAGRLMRVTESLEGLPDRLKAWLVPSAGGYNCRDVADTGQPSMHASGAAIDIGIRGSDYWAWSRARGEIPYRNRIPPEIVDAFEAERFIWGGTWYHYDTMHFEYRPELFA